MTNTELLQFVKHAAGIRLRLRLQPLYGAGEVVFPSTYSGGKYMISERRIPSYNQAVECAILDSVQSQANRMEIALLEDCTAGNIQIPHIETDFSDIPNLLKSVGKLTCFECPHRIFDAILRDSIDSKGVAFPLTDSGRAAINANGKDAGAIFQLSPASLLFGSWDSTGVSGGMGEKYTRCVVSEVVGINAIPATRAGTRIDPLNAASAINPKEILKDTKDEMWTLLSKSKKNEVKKPSELNHGSVPWDGGTEKMPHGGVTVDYVQQSTTISFAALRQLNFPVSGKNTKETSAKAHAVLAAIALHAMALNVEKGWHLRSRCDLVLDQPAVELEILGDSGSNQKVSLSATQTRALLQTAIKEAQAAGLPWNSEPLRLKPSKALTQLVIKSQQAHRESAAEE